MKKILLVLMAIVTVFSVCACSESTAEAKTVQEWFENNQEAIEAYCEKASSDTHTITLQAEENTFVFSVKFTSLTEEELTEAQQGAVNDQQKWNAKTAEEKQEHFETYVKTLEANGFEGMPMPDTLVTQLYDENNELVASTYFTK